MPVADAVAAIATLATAPTSTLETGAGIVDVLICGHGCRDRCCGSLGTALHQATPRTARRRTWRTSHLGGHRFAPTVLILPEGTTWAWLDAPLLESILSRSVAPIDLMDHYRGSSGADHPAVQVAESAVFAEVGWGWLDAERLGRVVDEAAGRWTVEIEGSLGRWEATVELVGTQVQPMCGDTRPGAKADDQLALTQLEWSGPAVVPVTAE